MKVTTKIEPEKKIKISPIYMTGFIYIPEEQPIVTAENIFSVFKIIKDENEPYPEFEAIKLPPNSEPPLNRNGFDVIKFDFQIPDNPAYTFRFFLKDENKVDGKVTWREAEDIIKQDFKGFWNDETNKLIVYGKWIRGTPQEVTGCFIELNVKH